MGDLANDNAVRETGFSSLKNAMNSETKLVPLRDVCVCTRTHMCMPTDLPIKNKIKEELFKGTTRECSVGFGVPKDMGRGVSAQTEELSPGEVSFGR